MAAKNKKQSQLTIDRAYKFFAISSLISLLVLLLVDIGLFIAYFITGAKGLIIALLVFSIVTIVGVGLTGFFVMRHNRRVLYLGMFNTTKENYNRIINQNNEFVPYDETAFSSFKELNQQLDSIETSYRKSIIFNGEQSYTEMPFVFTTPEQTTVTYESFIANYRQLIYRSLVFRNAFVAFNYKTNNKVLTPEEKLNFVNEISKIFDGVKILFADNTKNNQMLLFIPLIDSVDHFKEQLSQCVNSSAIIRYGTDGYSLLSTRVSAVIYPYSSIDDIISDLEYASRQNEQINIYLPKKVLVKNDNLLQMNVNLNFINNILEKFAQVNIEQFDSKVSQQNFERIIKEIIEKFGFEYTYLYAYDPDEQSIVTFFKNEHVQEDEKVNSTHLSQELFDAIIKHMDEDHSYFFSKRSNLSPDIGRFLDVYDINSGYFYVIIEDEKPQGLVMFCKKGELVIDSYLRESLYVFSRTMANLIYFVNANSQLRLTSYRLRNLLKIVNYRAYSVDKRNYKIRSISQTLQDEFPNLKEGQYCYEGLFGFNKPCKQCPLTSGHKIVKDLNGIHYESSLSLSIPRLNEKTVLLVPTTQQDFEIRERYDRDLLVNSYYSFLERMAFEFTTKRTGYVVVANIDNHDALISSMKPESYNEYLRSFFKDIIETIPEISDIYFLPNRQFAFVFAGGHRKEILPVLEKVYDLSKKTYLIGNQGFNLTMTYLAHTYPFGYQNSTEYVRYVLSLPKNYKEVFNEDKIILPETKYIRNASHKMFVNDILDNSLNTSSFEIKLQPMVNKKTKRIEAAEMLLRVSENYFGSEMNTFEIINAAAENNKIVRITKILIDHIEQLYQKYGDKLFARFGIKHLTLNTDYSFFQDLSFIKKIKDLISSHDLPKDFIGFEIQESEISKYSEEFASITKELTHNEINVFCDGYTGKFISLKKLKQLGFAGVKINRSVIAKVGTDATSMEGVVSYLKEAKELGLIAVIVGVETKEQNNALLNDSHQCYFQGYYYYKPIDAEELINHLLRQNS